MMTFDLIHFMRVLRYAVLIAAPLVLVRSEDDDGGMKGTSGVYFRYYTATGGAGESLEDDEIEATQLADDVRCEVCAVILSSVLGNYTTVLSDADHYDIVEKFNLNKTAEDINKNASATSISSSSTSASADEQNSIKNKTSVKDNFPWIIPSPRISEIPDDDGLEDVDEDGAVDVESSSLEGDGKKSVSVADHVEDNINNGEGSSSHFSSDVDSTGNSINGTSSTDNAKDVDQKKRRLSKNRKMEEWDRVFRMNEKDEEKIVDHLEGPNYYVPFQGNSSETTEGREQVLSKMSGCNRLYKDEFLAKGFLLEPCDDRDVGYEFQPSGLWRSGKEACLRKERLFRPTEKSLHTYLMWKESVYFSCEQTIASRREGLARYVRKNQGKTVKSRLEFALAACRKVAKCGRILSPNRERNYDMHKKKQRKPKSKDPKKRAKQDLEELIDHLENLAEVMRNPKQIKIPGRGVKVTDGETNPEAMEKVEEKLKAAKERLREIRARERQEL